MALLGQDEQALENAPTLLNGFHRPSRDPVGPGQNLAAANRWRDAARLQEQALCLAASKVRKATVQCSAAIIRGFLPPG